MPSAAYRELDQETRRLRRHLLPHKFDPLGNYAGAVRSRTRAYLILCHAAVETFLEAQARKVAKRAETAWNTHRRVTTPIAFLMGSIGEPFGSPGLSGPRAVEALMEGAVKRAFRDYFDKVKQNNGVKEASVTALFGSLGFPSVAFGSMLVPELNTFGKDRGDHAHSSSAVLTSVLDPETEFRRVERILTELKAFDGEISKFERLIR